MYLFYKNDKTGKENVMKNSKNFKKWCEDNIDRGRRLLAEWDEVTNMETYGRGISDFKPYSGICVYWVCEECGEQFKQPIRNRTMGHNHPSCSNKARKMKAISKIKEENSVPMKRPDLAKYLDENKNVKELGLSNSKITEFSSRVVYWKCTKCGYEWQAMVKNMSMREIPCKKCRALKKVEEHRNDAD